MSTLQVDVEYWARPRDRCRPAAYSLNNWCPRLRWFQGSHCAVAGDFVDYVDARMRTRASLKADENALVVTFDWGMTGF